MVDAINYNLVKNDVAAENKRLSDIKSKTNELTFKDSAKFNAQGEAAKGVRDKLDQLKIKALEQQTDDDYFQELMEEVF